MEQLYYKVDIEISKKAHRLLSFRDFDEEKDYNNRDLEG